MASTAQQQIAEPNILNLENKLRQQSKIAHELGAGSQCLKCGPKCKGFDLHYWRKVCRNCRCGKENHSVVEENNYDSARVGRLFEQSGNAADVNGQDLAPNLNFTAQQPTASSNRALVRQLPEHDLDPTKCQSLTDPEKQKMEEYVNNVKQFAVGRGTVQKCPAPPPQLDRILEQKLSLINPNNNVQKSPKVSPKPPPKLFGGPKPYTPFKTDAAGLSESNLPKSLTFTDQIKKQASNPSASSLSPEAPEPSETPEDLPPPPAEFLEPFAEESVHQKRPKDPVREFFDFLDEQEGKKLPGKLSNQSRSPFVSNFNATPKPFGPPRNVPKFTGNNKSETQHQVRANENIPQVLTTDFDYVPDNGNLPQQSQQPQQTQQPQQSQQTQQPQQQELSTQQPQQRPVAVEAEKVWFCFKCLGPILANQVAIFAERAGEDKCWHPDCFTCTICNETLADLIYFYAEGNIYCGRHYAEQMNIPRCKACDELIFATEYTNAEGANWHTNHFCCWICDTPLVGRQYTPIDGQPHCLDCYQKRYGKDCHACSKAIRADEARVSHGDLYWHASERCFRCQQCNNSLLNRQFLLKGQSTFCSRDCATQAKVNTDTK